MEHAMLRKVIVGLALAGGLALGTGIAVDSADAQTYGHGSLSVTKIVSPDPLGIGNTMQFPMTVTCTNPTSSYPLNVHGNTSTVPFNLPVGSICSVAETLPKPPPGCTWLAPVYSPATVTIASGMNVLTVTNGYQCKDTGSQECLKDLKAEVKCNPNGTYTVTLSVAGFTGTNITLTSQTPGVTVTPPQQPWAATTTWTITGATPGSTVTLTANATKGGGGSVAGTDLCCSGEIKIKMPECPQPPPIDVAIDKEEDWSGGLGRPVINIYIINVGPTITFGPGDLTVKESIPPGYIVTTINAPNWTCLPSPTWTGPGTLTCTYNLAGSLATSWGLSDSITIDGTYPGPWPFLNCAEVTVGASVGVDIDLTNNKVCRGFSGKPRTCDPVTTIQRAAECVCRYPNMVRSSKTACICLSGADFVAGRGCIPRIECRPPLIPNAAGTDCICPPGTVQKGRECVRQIDCRKPLIPNAAGTDCICPPGTVQKGRECVRRIECNRPAVPNAAGTACNCPPGMTAVGKRCVQRELQLPSIKLPGGRPRETPRGPRGDSPGAVR